MQSREPTQAAPGRIADLTLAFVVVLAVACLAPAAVLAFFDVPVAVGFAVGIPVAAPFGAYLYAATVHWVDTPRYWRDRGRTGGVLDYLLVVLVGGVIVAATVAVGITVDAPWIGAILGFPLALAADALVFARFRAAYVSWPPSETR